MFNSYALLLECSNSQKKNSEFPSQGQMNSSELPKLVGGLEHFYFPMHIIDKDTLHHY